MYAKVVIAHAIIVMVKIIMNVLHVLQPNIWMAIPVKIVTLPVMDVLKQDAFGNHLSLGQELVFVKMNAPSRIWIVLVKLEIGL